MIGPIPEHIMDFEYSAKSKALLERLNAFMAEHIYPNEQRFYDEIDQGDRWAHVELLEELKPKAKAAGLWNLFLPDSNHGAGLTNLVNLLNPDVIAIGGSVRNSELYVRTAIETMHRDAFAQHAGDVRVLEAELGDEAPAIGAALIALEKLGS